MHQINQLVEGAIIGSGGLLIFFGSLCMLLKAGKFQDEKQSEQMAYGFIFTLLGLAHTSRAFDVSHLDSARTGAIDWITYPTVVVVILWVIYRRVRYRASISTQDAMQTRSERD